jgi:transcriptional regulator with XRE-family HTH domain
VKGFFMDTTTLNINRLIECREKLGISKQEAAKRMDMSQPAYLRYESGQRIPSIQVIYHMADILGTSAAYLLGHTDNPDRTRYVIDAETNSELFEIVKFYEKTDEATRNRLIAYMKEFDDYCNK